MLAYTPKRASLHLYLHFLLVTTVVFRDETHRRRTLHPQFLEKKARHVTRNRNWLPNPYFWFTR